MLRINELDQIPAGTLFDYNHKNRTKLPDIYLSEFSQLMKKIERETGEKYELDITRPGKYPLKLWSNKERPFPCEVVMHDPEYHALNGVYNNVNEINDKIRQLSIDDYLQDGINIEVTPSGREVWKCPSCNCYGKILESDHQINHIPYPGSGSMRCWNCNYKASFVSKWKDVSVNPGQDNGIIGVRYESGAIIPGLGFLKSL